VSGTAQWAAVAGATLAAFAGAWLGRRLLPSMTLRSVRFVTGGLLALVGLGLLSGLL